MTLTEYRRNAFRQQTLAYVADARETLRSAGDAFEGAELPAEPSTRVLEALRRADAALLRAAVDVSERVQR